MTTEEELEAACDELDEAITEVADDTSRWTQKQSLDIYSHMAAVCRGRADLIRSEMGE